jgi:hypothetical protein
MTTNPFQYGARTTALEAASRLGLGVDATLSAARRFEIYLMATAEDLPWPGEHAGCTVHRDANGVAAVDEPSTPQAQPSTGTWPVCPLCAHPEHGMHEAVPVPCYTVNCGCGSTLCPDCYHPRHTGTICHTVGCDFIACGA